MKIDLICLNNSGWVFWCAQIRRWRIRRLPAPHSCPTGRWTHIRLRGRPSRFRVHRAQAPVRAWLLQPAKAGDAGSKTGAGFNDEASK